MRRLTLSTMRDLGMGKVTLEGKIMEEAAAVCEVITKTKSKPFSFNTTLNVAVANVICSVLFGDRYAYDDPELQEIVAAFNLLSQAGGFQNPLMFLPSFAVPALVLFQPKQIKTIWNFSRLRQIIMDIIQRNRSSYNPEKPRNFIDLYLNLKDCNTEVRYTDKHLFGAIMDLFMAGTETTSTTLLWLFLFLVKNPDVQANCRNEIFQNAGTLEQPRWEDRDRYPYVMATIMEAQRLGNISPVFPFHNAKHDVELRGFKIPKDTLLMPSFYSVHMNPKYWPEPEHFKPERFLLPDGSLHKNPKNFVPFGLGRRQCMGETLAKMELFIVLTMMLRKFDFKGYGHLPDLHEANFGVTLVPNIYQLVAEPLFSS